MSDEELALLKTVLAFPDEDGPRLVYADWWEQHGQCERSEFVRVELERLDYSNDCTCDDENHSEPCVYDRERRLQRREYELLQRRPFEESYGNCYEWFPLALQNGWHSDTGTFVFRRGFVDSVELPAADWLAHADAILAAHPVRAVRLTTRPLIGTHATFEGEWYSLISNGVVRTCRNVPYGTVEMYTPTLSVIHAEWPRIRFTLPDGSVVEPEKTT